jgi:hypothetical protein
MLRYLCRPNTDVRMTPPLGAAVLLKTCLHTSSDACYTHIPLVIPHTFTSPYPSHTYPYPCYAHIPSPSHITLSHTHPPVIPTHPHLLTYPLSHIPPVIPTHPHLLTYALSHIPSSYTHIPSPPHISSLTHTQTITLVDDMKNFL